MCNGTAAGRVTDYVGPIVAESNIAIQLIKRNVDWIQHGLFSMVGSYSLTSKRSIVTQGFQICTSSIGV